MKRQLYVILTLSLLLPLSVARAEPPQTLPPVKAPFAAPDFALQDMDGQTHHPSDYRGKVVILNFWATWCPPCRKEMPSMERARRKIEGEPIVILAVDVGEDEDTIFKFMANFPINFSLLLDREGTVVKDYPVVGLPTTFVIDPAGQVIFRAVGSREWDDDALLDQVRALIER